MGQRTAETVPSQDESPASGVGFDLPAVRFPAEISVAQFLATIVESTDDAIIGKSPDGIIFSWNAGAERLYGYSRDHVLGQSIELIIPTDRKSELEQITKLIRGGKRIDPFDTVRVRKGGSRVHVSLSISPIVDADGHVVGASSIARDISERKRAEDAERQASARLRAVVETVIDGIITIDDRGVIETVNPAAAHIFGYEADMLIGENVRMLMPESFSREHDTYLGNYLRTNIRKIIGIGREVQGRRSDGSVFPLELAVSETRLADRTIFTGVVRDISARRETEKALIESETRFRLMANNAPALIWLSGDDKGCTWFNRRWLEFTGRTMEQELGHGWTEGVHSEDTERCLRVYSAAFDAREPFEVEYRLRRFDGTYRWLRNTGVPIHKEDGSFAGFIGSCIDITDRKLDQESLIVRVADRTRALNEANKRLRQENEVKRRYESLLAAENRILEMIAARSGVDVILNTICEAAETLISSSRCAISVSPDSLAHGATSTMGPSKKQTAEPTTYGALAGEGIFPPLNQDCSIGLSVSSGDESLAPLQEKGIRSYWFEPITISKDRNVGTVGVYCTSHRRPDEYALTVGAAVARLAGIAIERDHEERQARGQFAQLAHVSRLATMGEMASGLAHELNQPLCAIVNFTEACVELVSQNGNIGEQLPQALSEVARQAERAGAVIRRLRDFVKRRDPERRAVDMNDIVHDVLALTKTDTRHSEVRVSTRLAKRIPKIHADSIQIEQVLVNLIRNACDAMREAELPTRRLTIETTRRRGVVEVTVSDSGPGIPDAIRNRLFDPFFTTKRDGMGMGLSISHSIVEAHDGRIWATPNRQGGTTFHFTLPTAWSARRGRR